MAKEQDHRINTRVVSEVTVQNPTKRNMYQLSGIAQEPFPILFAMHDFSSSIRFPGGPRVESILKLLFTNLVSKREQK